MQNGALDRIPDNFEVPQYEFLGRRVAAAKENDPVKAHSFVPKGEGNLADSKPLRTHVCAIERQVLRLVEKLNHRFM